MLGLGLAIVVLCAVVCTQLRLSRLPLWNADSPTHVAAGVPLMTTLDAYYVLHLARLEATGQFVAHGPAPARHYARPEPGRPGEWYDQRQPETLPLPSALVAALSPLAGGDIDRVALILPPLLSGLFMLPLFLCGHRLGVPAAGLMAGLAANLCLEYWRRTSLGWVDTDALNLFFPWLLCWLILGLSGSSRLATLLGVSALAGAVLWLFGAWYAKPGFVLVYAAALAVHLRLNGVGWRRMALCVAVLALCAGPHQLAGAAGSLADFAGRYLPHGTGRGLPWRFAEVWPTVSEARGLPWPETLALAGRRADVAAVGLLAFGGFALQRWRSMAALAPMLLLAALALFSSRRFVPYLAPFVGFGWGLLVTLAVRAAWRRWAPARFAAEPAGPALASLVLVPLLAAAWLGPAAAAHVPVPAVPAAVARDLQALAARLPPDSRLWTWWDLGFFLVDGTGFGVYHDGAAQYTPQTNLIAAGFTRDDPALLHALIRFVDREGNRGIERLAREAPDLEGLLSGIRRAAPPLGEVPVQVLFTADMLGKYPALQRLGSAEAGDAPPPLGMRWLPCQALAGETLTCNGQRIDLQTGVVVPLSATAPAAHLRRSVLIERGQVLREREYGTAEGATLQIVAEAGAVRGVYLLDEAAFGSNLNRMFVLGRYDATRFQEVFNDFPNARAYRVLPGPP